MHVLLPPMVSYLIAHTSLKLANADEMLVLGNQEDSIGI